MSSTCREKSPTKAIKDILRVTQETYYMMQNWQPLIATGMGTYNGTPYLLTSENAIAQWK